MDDARPSVESLSDPSALADRDDVEVNEWPLAVEQERFEVLREHYRDVAGTAVVGITSDAGEVLLQGIDAWSPPGCDVEPGEDWVTAARQGMESLTGQSVTIDNPERLERIEYCLDGAAAESHFTATLVYFSASLIDPEAHFLDDPTIPLGFEHDHLETTANLELDWFEAAPIDVHPNYKDRVELFLD